MLKRLVAVLAAAVFALTVFSFSVSAENPVVQTSFTPDPAPMVYDGVLYLYCGEDSEEDNGFYNMPDWRVYSTTDMVNWTDHGILMFSEDFEWADPASAWACQCIEKDGTFYLYVTVTNEGGRAIGVATSKSPTGPFKDALGKPLCGPNWTYIDPTVMIDDDGQAYLYFGNPTSYYCKLGDDMISVEGEIMQHDMTAEAFGRAANGAESGYVEGPWIYKRNDLYYLVYASKGVPEGISYSTSDSPLGPWEYRGEIMEPTGSTTIHPGIIEYKGHDYFFYHGVLLPDSGWNKRSTCVTEFDYNDDGTIPTLKHDFGGVEQLENLDPFVTNEAETMAWSSGVKAYQNDKRGVYIGRIGNEDFIKVNGVDFADGAKSFTAVLAVDGKGKLDIRLDSQYGPSVGTIELDGSNVESFKKLSCNVDVSGTHDIYFAFSGVSDTEFAFDNWQFSKEESGSASSAFPMVLIASVAAFIIIIAIVVAIVIIKKSAKK